MRADRNARRSMHVTGGGKFLGQPSASSASGLANSPTPFPRVHCSLACFRGSPAVMLLGGSATGSRGTRIWSVCPSRPSAGSCARGPCICCHRCPSRQLQSLGVRKTNIVQSDRFATPLVLLCDQLPPPVQALAHVEHPAIALIVGPQPTGRLRRTAASAVSRE